MRGRACPERQQPLALAVSVFQYRFVGRGRHWEVGVKVIFILNVVFSAGNVEGGPQGPSPHSACAERAHSTSKVHAHSYLVSVKDAEVKIPNFLSLRPCWSQPD